MILQVWLCQGNRVLMLEGGSWGRRCNDKGHTGPNHGRLSLLSFIAFNMHSTYSHRTAKNELQGDAY